MIPQVGQPIGTSPGTWTNNPTSYTYQWNRTTVGPISGATSSTYTPVTADVGFTLSVTVIAINGVGDSLPSTSAVTGIVIPATGVPVNTVLPSITGTAQFGHTLTASDGTWTNSPTSYTQQWKRNGVAITGQTGLTYVLAAADVGTVITVSVVATNSIGSSTPVTSAGTATVIDIIPTNATIPTITGTPQVGATLTANVGTWNNRPLTYTYQWNSSVGGPILGATASTYVPVSGDVGNTLSVSVVATNSGGSSTPATSSSTTAVTTSSIPVNSSLPAIFGVIQVGVTLTSSQGTWTNFPTGFALQWLKEGAAIPGATAGTYTLQVGDIDGLISLQVIASNGAGASLPALSNLGGPTLGSTVRYVSMTDGIDTNDGTTSTPGAPHGPWKTIAQVNSQTFAAGTTVLFKRGDRWDRSGGPSVNTTITPAGGGSLSGGRIVYDAYGTGANPIIDGSADASHTSNWTPTTTPNVWQSTQTFPPNPGFSNGTEYFNANDVGNILWNFSPRGGSAPAAVNNASFGIMKGAGVGGVWYSPGEGQTSLAGTSLGTWNFNTDNWTVQVYSVGNPATTMSGLRLALDGGGIFLYPTAPYSTFQNFTLQYIASSGAAIIRASNTIIRDCVIQWVGGGNISGASAIWSRAGDGADAMGSYDGVLLERIYFHQMYDVGVGPQDFTTGVHNNMTVRNCVFDQVSQAIWLESTSSDNLAATQDNIYLYNNTSFGTYGTSSWSAGQRPNGGDASWGLVLGNVSVVTVSNLNVKNNVFAGIAPGSPFGLLITSSTPAASLSTYAPVAFDYNCWKLLTGSPVKFGDQFDPFGAGNPPLSSWASNFGFDTHGLYDVDPLFTNQSGGDFTPGSGSPLLGAGANLYNQGVVWDFNRKPRPPSGPFTMGAFQ